MLARNVTIKDFLIVGIVVMMLVFVVYAVTLPLRPNMAAHGSSCQSNLNQIGKAIRCYMMDWNDTFPTNRRNTSRRPLTNNIPLSDSPDKRFQHGVNWVEALYPYVGKVGQPGDNEITWTCPSAKRLRNPRDRTDAVTYAINMNLLEQREDAVELPDRTLLVREMDRLCGAVCRPANISRDKLTRPKDPFLTDKDSCFGRDVGCKAKLHGYGSHIAFVDGHVKSFPAEVMTEPVWDGSEKPIGGRWWNSTNARTQFIAITP